MSRSLLQFARGVREKRPVGADGGAELIRLEQVVGRDRHETAITHLHLAVELQEPFVLPPVFWTETSTGEHQHQRIASLQLRERAVLGAMVRKLIVGKGCAGNDVGSHSAPFLSLSGNRATPESRNRRAGKRGVRSRLAPASAAPGYVSMRFIKVFTRPNACLRSMR